MTGQPVRACLNVMNQHPLIRENFARTRTLPFPPVNKFVVREIHNMKTRILTAAFALASLATVALAGAAPLQWW
jgi:hypothetical protein